MRRISSSRSTLISRFLVACCFGTLVSPALSQFRDVTPVKEPAVKHAESFEAQAPEPSNEEILSTSAANDSDSPEPESGSESTTTPAVEADTEMTPPEPPAESPAEPPAEPRKKLTIEELEALLDGEIEEAEDTENYGLSPLKFRGITVGQSSLQDLLDLWGQPFKIVKSPSSRIIKYRANPFRQVDVTVVKNTVVSVLIHLNDVLDPSHCASELRISNVEPCAIPDSRGNVMGMAFPERGVLFAFDARDPEMLVSKIQLEPVNPEPFVMRAEYDFDHNYKKNLEDLHQALEMSPRYARAHGVKAKILAEIGRFQDALESAEAAAHYDLDDEHYTMMKAEIMAQNGNHDAAWRILDELLARDELPQVLRAAGKRLQGDLTVDGSDANYKDAMDHHLRAIELAAPLANERDFAVRRMAKEILIKSHIAVARDVSLGDFQSQETVIPKWLKRARALVKESVERDQGDPAWYLEIDRQELATAADIRSTKNPTKVIDRMTERGEQLIKAQVDPRGKSRIQWKMGAALAEAVRLERIRGNDQIALEFADEALELLQASAKDRQSTPEQRYLVGRLYFHVGSMHAVQNEDHEEAIAWYRKAEPLLAGEVPPGVLADPGTHGEMFVSMGVSYWQMENGRRAIALTEQGTDILQRAVVQGILEPESLAIPYGNLATMNKNSGNNADAEAFAELAASLSGDEVLR